MVCAFEITVALISANRLAPKKLDGIINGIDKQKCFKFLIHLYINLV